MNNQLQQQQRVSAGQPQQLLLTSQQQQPRIKPELDVTVYKFTNSIFNPKNLKIYQIVLIVFLAIYLFITLFHLSTPIISTLLIVGIIAMVVAESFIIFTAIDFNV